MRTVSMLEFRQNALAIIKKAMRGQRMLLTYRGKPVLRLEPVVDEEQPSSDDPFYRLDQLADVKGKGLTNREMDRIIYET